MDKKGIIHLHGFASSARSTKARYLAERFRKFPEVEFLVPDFNPTPRDFEYMTVTGMINRLRQYVLDRGLTEMSLTGSSLGGLVALHYAHRFGGVRQMLLLAPLLSYRGLPLNSETLSHWEREGAVEISHYGFAGKIPLRYDFHIDGLRYSEVLEPAAEIRILHGINDEVVPVENSRDYASKFPGMVTLTELPSDHGLLDQTEEIWKHVGELF